MCRLPISCALSPHPRCVAIGERGSIIITNKSPRARCSADVFAPP